MVPLDRALVSSYRLVAICSSLHGRNLQCKVAACVRHPYAWKQSLAYLSIGYLYQFKRKYFCDLDIK